MPKRKRVYNLKSLIISALRKIFFYSPLRRQALEKAKVGNLYRSGINGQKYPINCVTVDHIIPVIDLKKGFVDWNTFIERLFCPVENLQVISKDEHSEKTKAERKKRKSARSKN